MGHLSERDALRTMLRRAAIAAADDQGTQQLVKLTGLAGETLQNVVRVQPFGLSSNPPAGGEGLILCLGGRSDRAMFVGGEHPNHRPKNIPVGGTMLYDAFGQYLEFVQQSVKLVATVEFVIQAPLTVIEGGLQVKGQVTGDVGGAAIDIAAPINQTAGGFTSVGDGVFNGISVGNHDHPVHGVQTGPSTVTTGLPVG